MENNLERKIQNDSFEGVKPSGLVTNMNLHSAYLQNCSDPDAKTFKQDSYVSTLYTLNISNRETSYNFGWNENAKMIHL